MLAYHFLHFHSIATNKKIESISDEALGIFNSYAFPGNVRELNNIIERAVMLCPGGKIDASLLPQELLKSTRKISRTNNLNLKDTLKECEKQTILKVLQEVGWKKTEASIKLGISRKTLWEKLKKHDIKLNDNFD